MPMTMTDNPWAGAQEAFNKFARQDREVAQKLNNLSQHEARDNKLAFAIEEGRVYGLRQQKYDMVLKKQLNRDYKRPPVAPMW